MIGTLIQVVETYFKKIMVFKFVKKICIKKFFLPQLLKIKGLFGNFFKMPLKKYFLKIVF